MSLEHLGLVAGVHRPEPARLIATCGEDLVSLRVEGDLGNFKFMTLK
jgi:hypothetical protein